MSIRNLALAALASLSFAAMADVPHFVVKSQIQVDATGWKLSEPRYLIANKPYRIGQWEPSDTLSNAICKGLGYKTARNSDVEVGGATQPMDYVVFYDDGRVNSVNDHDNPGTGNLYLWDSLICEK